MPRRFSHSISQAIAFLSHRFNVQQLASVDHYREGKKITNNPPTPCVTIANILVYLISILDIDRYSYSDRYGHRYKLKYKYRYICTESIKPVCPLTQIGPLRHRSLCRTSVIPWRWGLNFDTIVRRERLPSWHERRLTIALFRRSDFPGFWELLLGMCGVTRASEVGDTE